MSIMPRTFCLLNHKLTPRQLEELEVEFQSAEVVCSPEVLSLKWSQIHPKESREMVVDAVVHWLQDNHAQPGDLFVVQGEFGCTFTLVDYALRQGLVPLYATTIRIAQEIRTGEQVHRQYLFEHAGFRQYQYYRDESR